MERTLVLASVLLVAGCSAGGTSNGAGSALPPRSTVSPAPSDPAVVVPSAVPPESNPPGDIPDDLAFVPYTNATGRYSFTHPEGWSESTLGSQVTFTDKLNGVQVMPGPDSTAPTVGQAKTRDVPALQTTEEAFELRSVTAVDEPGRQGVRILYRRNSAADEVTGRQYRDEVERYELVSNGREVVMELFGPVGADNVDAYRTMLQSLRLS